MHALPNVVLNIIVGAAEESQPGEQQEVQT